MKVITRIVIVLIVVGLVGWSAYLLYQKSEEKPITFKTEQPFITNIIRKKGLSFDKVLNFVKAE
jgi:hypothetical protein